MHDLETIIVLVLLAFNFIPHRSHHAKRKINIYEPKKCYLNRCMNLNYYILYFNIDISTNLIKCI